MLCGETGVLFAATRQCDEFLPRFYRFASTCQHVLLRGGNHIPLLFPGHQRSGRYPSQLRNSAPPVRFRGGFYTVKSMLRRTNRQKSRGKPQLVEARNLRRPWYRWNNPVGEGLDKIVGTGEFLLNQINDAARSRAKIERCDSAGRSVTGRMRWYCYCYCWYCCWYCIVVVIGIVRSDPFHCATANTSYTSGFRQEP